MRYTGLLGGSFNPVHIGHIRLAIEIAEALRPHSLDLVPCAIPPHKPHHGLLPFDLRHDMLLAATRALPTLRVNPIERSRPGPSYTWDTLSAYAQVDPGARLFFVLGGEDYHTLPHWHRGRELPALADMVVVPRAGADRGAFMTTTREYWPEARPDGSCGVPGSIAYSLPGGTRLIYLPLPRLDISASLIRDKWMAGSDISLLVPDAVRNIMRENATTLAACWGSPDVTPVPETTA